MYQKKPTMKAHHIITFILTSLLQSTIYANPKSPDFITVKTHRRILHEPLFPATSAPPPENGLLPPPPLPDTSDSPDLDQPFSNELPNGPLLDQESPPPPPLTTTNNAAVANQNDTSQPSSSSIKKVVIAIASVILILAAVSVFVCYLHKNRTKRHDESRKLVSGNSQRINEEDCSRMPPSPVPARNSVYNEVIGRSSGSPYRKLNTEKRFDHCDIQPLPPFSKALPQMLSSHDESHENIVLAPKLSFTSNKSPTSSLPHSKRTSPRSRLSVSSPDTNSVMKLSIKQSMPPSPPPAPPTKTLLTYNPKRSNLSPSSSSKIPNPPPPPPPLLLSSVPRKHETCTSLPVTKLSIRPQSKSNTSQATQVVEKSSSFDDGEKDTSRARMKPLRWDKVQATSDKATVWDHLKSSSFQLNENAMKSLFGSDPATLGPKEAATTKKIIPPFVPDDRVLDSRKSQNIAILLRALNVTREEVSEALLDGNAHGLGSDLLGTLVRMAPTKDEEIKLKNYNGDISKLGPAERFLKAILDIPFAFQRVEAMLYIANFESEVTYLRKSFQTLEEASRELKSSRLFLKLLEAVLRTGNRMNDGTNRGDAKAFKLDTLLKLVDIKATDGKTTLVHFVVQEIIKSEGAGYDPTNESLSNKTSFKFKEEDFTKQGLRVVSGLSKELSNVKMAAGMDSDVLSNYVSKLETGLQKVVDVLQYEDTDRNMQGTFFDSIKVFRKEAIDEISKVKAEERKAMSLVKDVTQYFHGDAAKVEGHPFRIFMIVKDFLSVLDNVCKDVGRMQDRATIGAGRSFRIPITASLPAVRRYNVQHDRSTSDDDSL